MVAATQEAISVAEAALFLAWYGLPWKKPDRPVAWQLWIFSAGYGAETVLMFLLILGIFAPVGIFLLVFAVMNLALLHQLILLWRVRHEARMMAEAGGRTMAVQSTQTKHPWRATVRTAAAAIVALLPVMPEIADRLGVATFPVVGSILAVAAGVTRVLAMPSVEAWLHRFIPWLAAQPAPVPAPPVWRPDAGPDQGTLAN